MPRGKSKRFSSIDQLTNQARRLLSRIRQEVRSKETELLGLKRHESSLVALAAGSRSGTTRSRSGGSRKRASRINWNSVLAELPKQFKASAVRGVRGLKDKRSSEIFAAITRWIEAGTVKRKERGVYERVK